jgi:UDP:flavonoid glycosyltransferase YjiC (YdhE family)
MDRRPFVGALTMELPTDADEEVASWIAAGTPPIFFGLGSMPVESPARRLGKGQQVADGQLLPSPESLR